MGRLRALLLGPIAIAGMAGAIAPDMRMSTQTVVTPPASPAKAVQKAPMPVNNETEKERFDRLRSFRPRNRVLWDGKSRSPGDRAHKRMKRRRAAGRA